MKVYNLTDIETPKLRQHKLVQQTLAVGRALIEPGGSADVLPEQTKAALPGIQRLVSLGALAVGTLPAAYASAKDKARNSPPPLSPPSPKVVLEAPLPKAAGHAGAPSRS